MFLQTCRCFPGFHSSIGLDATCKKKDDLVCVNELMNMMGEFDKVEYKVTQNFVVSYLMLSMKILYVSGQKGKVPIKLRGPGQLHFRNVFRLPQ
jgi:hypothetical protein